jgi:poly(3-hydroxybutyrate) depolymerase
MRGQLQRRFVRLIFLLSFLSGALTARSQELFKDPISNFVFDASVGNNAPPITVWYYRPDHVERSARVVFLMHGSSRTGKEARDLGMAYAKRYALIRPEQFGTGFTESSAFL